MNGGFLNTGKKKQCFGCEACINICPHSALSLKEDQEGFRYPVINLEACVHCNLCHKACPEEYPVEKNDEKQIAFGGYSLNSEVRSLSTSGGAFSCIVETWCKDNYVIFGAFSHGLDVRHGYITDKKDIDIFRKSKYSQSVIGNSYYEARKFLKEGKNVLFSGTPCQIAGLRAFLKLGNNDLSKLLTVEVVCEGVPSPLYIRKLNDSFKAKYQSTISSIDYRSKENINNYNPFKNQSCKGKWDFEVMRIELGNGKVLKKDRWFNPFWNIWLNHLMNRPSCYKCPFTTQSRVADITLGDLWGVHIYCPELYGDNGGASLMISNTLKGYQAMTKASKLMYGHDLDMEDVIRFQGPMRKCVPCNPQRDELMKDLANPIITYQHLTRKWATKPGLRLLFNKYIWGNHQKVRFWKIKKLLVKL